eukprot:78219-Prymnesium_polylepis.1
MPRLITAATLSRWRGSFATTSTPRVAPSSPSMPSRRTVGASNVSPCSSCPLASTAFATAERAASTCCCVHTNGASAAAHPDRSKRTSSRYVLCGTALMPSLRCRSHAFCSATNSSLELSQ